MDSCPGRLWLALTPMHRGVPVASLYLTEGGYGSAGTLGSIQKFITPLCFYYHLLCSSGEAVKFSSVSVPMSAALRRWGVRASCLSAGPERCFIPPNRACAIHSCSLFLLGFVFVNSPIPPSKLTACVGGAAS